MPWELSAIPFWGENRGPTILPIRSSGRTGWASAVTDARNAHHALGRWKELRLPRTGPTDRADSFTSHAGASAGVSVPFTLVHSMLVCAVCVSRWPVLLARCDSRDGQPAFHQPFWEGIKLAMQGRCGKRHACESRETKPSLASAAKPSARAAVYYSTMDERFVTVVR